MAFVRDSRISPRSSASRARRSQRVGVTADALAMQDLAKLASNHGDHEWAQRGWNLAEEFGRTVVEIGVVHPSGMDQRPIGLILSHLFECPGGGALLGAESAIEIEIVCLLDVPANEGRVRNAFAVVIDVRQLALGSFAESVGLRPIGQPGHLQEDFDFRHEWARIRQPERRPEGVERHHDRDLPASRRLCRIDRSIQLSGTINSPSSSRS